MTDRADLAEDRLDNLVALERDTQPSFAKTGEGSYRFMVPKAATTFEVDFSRREGGQFKGEVLVRCELAGAATVDGVLTVSDLNLSASRTRASFANHIHDLARTKKGEVDWKALVEEFAVRVLAAERQGEPAVLLSEVPEPEADRILDVEGLPILATHPMIVFGDGGTAKSLLALWLAGKLVQDGVKVALFDWELDEEEHRLRLGRLFQGFLPPIHYCRCSRPLVYEADRLRRIVREHELDYAIFDSVGFASDGAPETSEAAIGYQQAFRAFPKGLGQLHIAHVTKALEGGDLKPYGSVFWHNAARATWNVKLANGQPGDSVVHVALHHRKFNTTGRHRSLGYELSFAPGRKGRIGVRRVDLAGVPDLAADLSIPERVVMALRPGPMSRDQLAVELEDVEADTLRKSINRMKRAGKLLEFPERGLVLPDRGHG